MTIHAVQLSSPADLERGPTYEHVAHAGDFIFVAGQIARGENNELVGVGDAGEQAAQIYRNIGKILAHVRAQPSDVAKINTILVSAGDRAAVAAERLKFFGKHQPPHTGIIVSGLGAADVKVEVEIVVYLPR